MKKDLLNKRKHMKEIKVKKPGRDPKNQKAFDKINNIAPGYYLIMKKKDWKMKTLPGAHIIRRYTNREFKVETLLDESGWVISAL